MRPILLAMVVGISVTFLGSCKKNTGDSAATLTGYWELRFVEGGYRVSGISGSFPPGNGSLLKFKGASYWSYSGGQARDSGQYQITKDTLTMFHTTYKMDYFFQLSNNTLTLSFGTIAADGTISTYARLNTSQIDPALQ
ncbi:MAG TPA: hypothetical protein VF939_16620 [Puia sp.]